MADKERTNDAGKGRKKVLRPQDPRDEVDGLREALMQAPDIVDVYKHYRGENLPDEPFFSNALTDKFKIPGDKWLSSDQFYSKSARCSTH